MTIFITQKRETYLNFKIKFDFLERQKKHLTPTSKRKRPQHIQDKKTSETIGKIADKTNTQKPQVGTASVVSYSKEEIERLKTNMEAKSAKKSTLSSVCQL